ncbi:MAG: hypothetical protein LBR62_00380 [Puniceicoccales bacterium]|jgi:hypothetical protein|nr:hypothetical protein [Puniceicoccales bacterium]
MGVSKYPLFFSACEYYSLLGRIKGKKHGMLLIEAIEDFKLGITGDGENVGDESENEKTFRLVPRTPTPTVCSVAPPNRFIHRVKLDPKVKKQGLSAFGPLLKERFNIDLATHKVNVLNADTGESVDPKSIPNNVCFVGGGKRELADLQNELLKRNLYPQQILLTTLGSISGLMHYAGVKKITGPILFAEISLTKSYVFVIKEGRIEASYPFSYGLKNIVQAACRERKLADEVAAYKYLTSEVGAESDEAGRLVSRMVAELKSYIGFFEVQNSLSVDLGFFNQLPPSLEWIGLAVSRSLGIEFLEVNYVDWLRSRSLAFNEGLLPDGKPPPRHWFGILSLMVNHF